MTISAISRPPAITNRSPADQNGGISPRTALTAAAFEPPRTTKTATASKTGRDVTEHLPVHGTPSLRHPIRSRLRSGVTADE